MDLQRRRHNTASFFDLLGPAGFGISRPSAPGEAWRGLIGLLWLSAGTESGYFSEQDVIDRVLKLGISSAAQQAWMRLSGEYRVVGALETEWLMKIDFGRRPVREQKARLLREFDLTAPFEAVLVSWTSGLVGDPDLRSFADDLMFGSAEEWKQTLEDELGEPFRVAAAQWIRDEPSHEAADNGMAVQPAERLLDALKYMNSVADVLAGLNQSNLIPESLRQEYVPDLNLLATAGIRIPDGEARSRFNVICASFFDRYGELAGVESEQTAHIRGDLTRLVLFWDECTQFSKSAAPSVA